MAHDHESPYVFTHIPPPAAGESPRRARPASAPHRRAPKRTALAPQRRGRQRAALALLVSGIAVITIPPGLVGAQAAHDGARGGAGGGARSSGVTLDSVPLTLEQALARALGESQEVRLARAQVAMAGAQVTAVRAQALPQVDASLSYTRTYRSPFSGGGMALPDSMKFEPDSTASVLERLSYLEDNAGKAGLGGIGALFGSLPFGRPNTYVGAIKGSQVLYSGGRVGSALKIASAYRDVASLDYREQVAEVALQVRRAYVRAALSQQLEQIAQAALDQAERFLAHERLQLQSGTASELELLRADVAAENLRPQLVEARNAAEVSLLDLKRLVDLPLTQPIRLTTALVAPARVDTLGDPDPARVADERSAVTAADRLVAIREQQVRMARGSFLPSVGLSVNYGGQRFPSTVWGVGAAPLRRDVSASIGVQLPIFTGFRRTAELDQAQLELERSRLQLGQLREGVQVEYQRARGERARALASISARTRNVEQAQRVHDLTVLRYEQGLATQLEVSDGRLALLQARTNLAQATADFLLADASVDRALGRVGPHADGRTR